MHTAEQTPLELRNESLALLRQHFTENRDPLHVRYVVPYMNAVFTEDTEYADFITPFETDNRVAACLLSVGRTAAHQQIVETLPSSPDFKGYYRGLLQTAKGSADEPQPSAADLHWATTIRPFTEIDDRHSTDQPLKEATSPIDAELWDRLQRKKDPQHILAGLERYGELKEHVLVGASIWLVCRQKTAANIPVATHIDRLPDALELMKVMNPHGYDRAARSITGALSRTGHGAIWQRTYDHAMEYLARYPDVQQGFRLINQPTIRRYALNAKQYGRVVSSEKEAYEFSSQGLTLDSIATLCHVIRMLSKTSLA